jgi:hypothetical protein
MKKALMALCLCLTGAGVSLPAMADDDEVPEVYKCTLNGKRVKPAKSGYYEFGARSGQLVCIFLDGGKTVVNETLSGQPPDALLRFNSSDATLQGLNKKGEEHGLYKNFSSYTAVVLHEGQRRNGKRHGREIRRNHETGVLQSLAVYEDDALLVHLTYDANGNVRAAACNTRSVIEEDIKPCGFDGKPRRAATDVVNAVKELK